MPDLVSAVGVIVLIFCVILLFAPLFGWRFKFCAEEMPVTLDIPKPGRYAFFISRYRAFGSGTQVKFSIAVFDARAPIDETRLISSHSMNAPSGGPGYAYIKAGEFNAPYPGKYAILSLADSRLAPSDKIIIKRHTRRIWQLLAIVGITISPFMFTTGLAGGLVSLIGLVGGITLLILNM